MNTAIIINLDYETQPIGKCQQFWKLIEMRMSQAGFAKNNRLFVSAMDAETAFKQARGVMDRLEEEYRAKGEGTLQYIREFYGIPYAQIIDLAAPSSQAIEVDLMATGAFQKFFT